MIRFALDSDDLHAFPVGVAPILLTYSDLFPTRAELVMFEMKHPDSQVVLIDRGLGDPTGLASVADVERLAFTLADLRRWFERKKAAAVRFLTAYSDRNTLPSVDTVLAGLRPWHWVATLDGTVDIPSLAAPLERPGLVQCFSAAMLGVPCDGSLILNDAWHPSAK